LRVVFPRAGLDPLKAGRRPSGDSPKDIIGPLAKSGHFRRVSEGVDDIILAFHEFLQNAFGEYRGAEFLAQFISNLCEMIARRCEAATLDFVAQNVGKRVVLKSATL